MDDHIRQAILSQFPRDAYHTHSDTCLYKNTSTGLPCGQPSFEMPGGTPFPACLEHHLNFNIYCTLIDFENWNEATRQPVSPQHFVEDEHLPLAIPLHPAEPPLTYDGLMQLVENPQVLPLYPPATRDDEYGMSDFSLYLEPVSECCVCLEGKQLLSLSCQHVTCLSCYNKLHTRMCPMCRVDIVHSLVRRLPVRE